MTDVNFEKTSEAVSTGHPDKVADQIADAILDLLRTHKEDPQSAVEVSCSANIVFIFGEIDKVFAINPGNEINLANPELAEQIKETALNKIREIGYTENDYNPNIVLDLVLQSGEINKAVEKTEEKEVAAGDQGIVSGYATNETTNYHQLHFTLAHELLKELEYNRKNNILSWLNPDAKSQVTVEYKTSGNKKTPQKIKHVLLSQCHASTISLEDLRNIIEPEIKNIITNKIKEFIVDSEIRKELINSLNDTIILINPAGAWNIGGPVSDSGLTGRKLVVDNYGSASTIGGGATSGKNLNKVDRSGAYYARHIAKSIIHSGLADEVKIELSFAIGESYITSINIETFGTEHIKLTEIYKRVENGFGFHVQDMINASKNIDKFTKASEHGNYTNNEFPWEQVKTI